MIGGLLGLALFGILAAIVLWGRQRYRKAGEDLRDAEPAIRTDLVRVDIEAVEGIASIAPSLAGLKRSKLARQHPGRRTMGGIVVFGPQRLTWAPEDGARRLGMRSWTLPWADIESGSVRPATDTASAVMVLGLPGGEVLELQGVDAVTAQAALDRYVHGIAAEPDPTSTEP